MDRSFAIKTKPLVEPVTLELAKQFAKITQDEEDSLLTTFIAAARELAELYTRRAFINQTWVLSFDEWPTEYGGGLAVPISPLKSVTQIRTLDEDDDPTVITSDAFYLDTRGIPGMIYLKDEINFIDTDREHRGIEVEYVAGYGATGNDVPNGIQVGIMEVFSYIEENRIIPSELTSEQKEHLYRYVVIDP